MWIWNRGFRRIHQKVNLKKSLIMHIKTPIRINNQASFSQRVLRFNSLPISDHYSIYLLIDPISFFIVVSFENNKNPSPFKAVRVLHKVQVNRALICPIFYLGALSYQVFILSNAVKLFKTSYNFKRCSTFITIPLSLFVTQ